MFFYGCQSSWLCWNWHFHKNYSAAITFDFFETDIFKKRPWLPITFDFFETGIFTKTTWLQIILTFSNRLFSKTIHGCKSKLLWLLFYFCWKSQTWAVKLFLCNASFENPKQDLFFFKIQEMKSMFWFAQLYRKHVFLTNMFYISQLLHKQKWIWQSALTMSLVLKYQIIPISQRGWISVNCVTCCDSLWSFSPHITNRPEYKKSSYCFDCKVLFFWKSIMFILILCTHG